MARIPIIQDSENLLTQTQPSRVRADAEDFGAAKARGLRVVAQGLNSAASAIDEIEERFDRANLADLDTRLAEYEREAMHDPDTGFMNLRGRNALDARDGFQQSFDARVSELAGLARNDRVRAAFARVAAARRDSAFSRADSHASGQIIVYENGISEARMAAASRAAAADPFNDDEILRNIGVVREEAEAFGRRNGMAPEVVAELVATQSARVAEDIWELRAQRDPRGVRALLNDEDAQGPLLDALTAQQRARLLEGIDRELERRAAQWRASIRDQVSTVSYLLENGGALPERLPSVDDVRSAMGPEAAATFAAQVEAYSARGRMAGMTNAEIANAITAPREGASQEEIGRSLAIRAAGQAVLAMRANAPVEYARGQGLLAEDGLRQALAQGDMAGVADFIWRRRGALEEQARRLGPGTSALPVTRQEAGELRRRLDLMDADSRAQWFRHLRQRLGGGAAYRALTETLYADDAASHIGASVVGRAGSVAGAAGRVDADTVGRRLMDGARILSPGAVDPEGLDNVPGRRGGRRQTALDMPSESALQAAWRAAVGDAYRDDPEQEARLYQAYRAYYASIAQERGLVPQDLEVDVNPRSGNRAPNIVLSGRGAGAAQEAVNAVTGGIITNRDGVRAWLPWGMSEESFARGLEAGWPAMQRAYGDVLAGARPQDFDYRNGVEPGTYFLMRGGARVTDAEGRPVVLRFRTGR